MRRGLVASRDQAADAIAEGRVLVAGTPAAKPSRLVAPDEPVRLAGPRPRFVSRGGEKLDAALGHFGIDVSGCRVLDAGSSTGGFVDCLLQRGAAAVTAVDVGRGQLDPALRADHRVAVREGTNVRSLLEEDPQLQGAADVVTADLSFISLRTVAPALVGLARPDGVLIVLVKPQFEAGRAAVSRGKGVIRQPELWRAALGDVASALTTAGAAIMGAMVSPLRGPAGNVEFFLCARRGARPTPPEQVDAWLTAAVDAVSGE